MHPGAGGVRRGADLLDRIDRAAVDVADLRDDDRRAVVSRAQGVGERVGAHRPAVVGSHQLDRSGPQAEQPQRAIDRHVALLTGEHPDARRAGNAVALDVVAHGPEHAVAGGGQRSHMRHLAAGDKRERRGHRKPEQIDQPPPGDRFEGGRRRGGSREARVLIPCGGEPVRRDPRRMRASHHEPEEARRVDPEQARLGLLDQLGDHLVDRHRGVSERPRYLELLEGAGRPDRTVGDSAEPVGGSIRDVVQQRARIHAGEPNPSDRHAARPLTDQRAAAGEERNADPPARRKSASRAKRAWTARAEKRARRAARPLGNCRNSSSRSSSGAATLLIGLRGS